MITLAREYAWDLLMRFAKVRSEFFYSIFGRPNLPNLTLDERCRLMKHIGGPKPASPLYSSGAVFCMLRWASEIACLGQALEMAEWHAKRRPNVKLIFVVTHKDVDALIKVTKGEHTIMYDPTMNMTRELALVGTHKELYGYPESEWWGGMPTKGMALMSIPSMLDYFYAIFSFPGPFFKYLRMTWNAGITPWLGMTINLAGASRFMNVGGTVIYNSGGKEVYRLQETALGILPTIKDLDDAADQMEGRR